MSVVSDLKAKYPHQDVYSEPVVDCSVCKGAGEFPNQRGSTSICLCVCIEGDDTLRHMIVDTFQTTIKSIRAECLGER